MFMQILPNMLAMTLSAIAAMMLTAAATKIGGIIGKAIDLIVVGVFLSVTLHAGFELAAALNFLTEHQLMLVMGALLSAGSLCFIMSAFLILKKLKQ